MVYSPYHYENMWLALQSSAPALQAMHDEVSMSRKGRKNEQKMELGGVTSSKWFHLLETMVREGTSTWKWKDDLGFNLDAHNMGYSTKHKSDMASQCPDGGKIDHMVLFAYIAIVNS
ncbi:uncharacterized protein LOC131155635 isoform X3 [Malania oleifera]|uniref:uncharacterized protein LOC131155635 isoform X3 n=1 Tax=Malania oleifera TaxID=397392 RepID=UPI0025ADA226|nr:uncharacterized protein LOC131155635 isoform X3 [Malania oleifera]